MKKVSSFPESFPPRFLRYPAGRAVSNDEMIREGDRILMGISGNKGSLWLVTSDKPPTRPRETGL